MMTPTVLSACALVAQLAVMAIHPVIFLGGPKLWLAVLVSAAALTLGAVPVVMGWPYPGQSPGGLWIVSTFFVLAAQNWLLYRLSSSTSGASFQKVNKQKAEQVNSAHNQVEALKSTLSSEEARLKEALRFYSIVWDLAECLGFEQMKRVLERELKSTMPFIMGFSLYVKNNESGVFEPSIRHRLWLEGPQWSHPEGSLIPRGDYKAGFSKDASGKNLVVAPIAMADKLLGYFVGDITLAQPKTRGGSWSSSEILMYMTTLADQLKFGVIRATSFAKVEQLSRIDSLTGLFRRGMFDRRIRDEMVRAATFKSTLCLIMLDIDHFKMLNDKWGHLFGDTVLKRTSAIIQQNVYETDFVARYGGEEFAILLPRADEEGALRKAEMIRSKVENEIFYSEDRLVGVHCTVSIGIAFYPRDAQDAESLIASADQALYYSKHYGRNRVTSFSSIKAY